MVRGVFITGTDTGVGKTFVACALARSLRDFGYRVGVMKPVETGCAERAGELSPEDAVRLKEASGCDEPMEKICPYRFREPLAPSVAAAREGASIDIGRLMDLYGEICSRHDVSIVEGAGGLMAPLLPSFTYADLAGVLKLPLIVVAANKLGVINHLLLTLEHASCKGLRVLGYVLNQPQGESSLAAETNREALWTLTPVPCLGETPYVPGLATGAAVATGDFEERFDLTLLKSILP